jgi:glycine/D-amino acid oxidase-like deaminating enzyme
VVGAGIAGVTTAILLKEEGNSVALLERDGVGTTSTGYTTTKITSQYHLKYHELIESVGLDKARLHGEAN